MKCTLKLTAAALCGALLLAGCSGDTSWAYEQGGERMPAGVYITGMIDAYGTPWVTALEEGATDLNTKTVLATPVDEQDATLYIQEEAQRKALMYYGAKAKSAEMGVALTEEELADAKSTVASIWNGQAAQYLQQYMMMYGNPITSDQYLMLLTGEEYEKNGVLQSSLEEYYINQSLKDRLFDAIYGEGGTEEVSEEALFAQFTADYAKASMMYVAKKVNMEDTPDAEIDAENAEIKIKAEGYLERLKNGEAIEDLQYEYDLSRAEEGAEVTKYDVANMTTFIDISSDEENTPMQEAMRTAAPNEPVLVEDEYYFYVVYPYELQVEDMANYRSSVLYKMKQAEFESMLETAGAALSPTANQSAISRYTPKKLKL